MPPAFRPLRFQEDYSYLADPAKRVDPFDAVKYLPLGFGGPSVLPELWWRMARTL